MQDFTGNGWGRGSGIWGPSEWKNEMLGFGVIIHPIADTI